MYRQGPSKDFYGENVLSLWTAQLPVYLSAQVPFRILCNKNPVQIDHLTQNFFHPSHIFSNVSTTMLPFFNLQNLGFKRKKYSRMCFLIPKHYLPHPAYCVTWEYLLELHLKDIFPWLHETMELVTHLFPALIVLWMYKIEVVKITRRAALNHCFSGLRMYSSV